MSTSNLYSEWRDFYAEKIRSWMSLEELRAECGQLQTVDGTSPELLLIHAMHALEGREQLAERDQLAAALEAAREDAERWRHARRILTVEDIESSQDIFDAFGVEGDEHENRKVDAAIDRARWKENSNG